MTYKKTAWQASGYSGPILMLRFVSIITKDIIKYNDLPHWHPLCRAENLKIQQMSPGVIIWDCVMACVLS